MNKSSFYFVVSLPRTGTMSLCSMANDCGFKFKHAPGCVLERDMSRGFNFFSDTPCYVPSSIEKICSKDIDSKFIYIEKEYDQIFNSWKKVKLYRNYESMYNSFMNEKKMSNSNMFDFKSYHEAFSEEFLDESNYERLFESHKQKVLSIIKQQNKELLMYSFADGWDPFCKFLNCAVPSKEMPRLNINTMFDKIV